jgi:hypothetical protein
MFWGAQKPTEAAKPSGSLFGGGGASKPAEPSGGAGLFGAAKPADNVNEVNGATPATSLKDDAKQIVQPAVAGGQATDVQQEKA